MQGKLIDIVSDSTGETAEKVVRAAMLQFPHSGAQIRMHTRVRTKEAARPVLERAAKDNALVVFTVVSPELREFIHAQSYELKVEALDLIGSLIGKLSTFLDRQPINMPSAMLPLSDEYFRRIEAVEFAVKSDDGKEPRNFKKADIVLVGVSRTSKTPLSTILAQRGLKVANLPLVLDLGVALFGGNSGSGYLFEDVLVRSLDLLGFKTRRVMNVTDVGHLTSQGDEGEDKMEVGAASQTVEIGAQAAPVETVNATLGQSVTGRALTNMPLNGRDTLDLALLQPGVTESNDDNGGAEEDRRLCEHVHGESLLPKIREAAFVDARFSGAVTS